jgi:hypothetical protein
MDQGTRMSLLVLGLDGDAALLLWESHRPSLAGGAVQLSHGVLTKWLFPFSAETRHQHSELSWRGMIRPLSPICWGEFKGGHRWPEGQVLLPHLQRDGPFLCANNSLPELLLCPSRRFEEYLHLLYALRLHTPVGHGDREDLTTAIDQMKKYKGHIDQVGCA